MPNPQCSAITKTGERCGAFAVDGSEFCFNHDPSLVDEKMSAVKKGGEAVKRAPLPPVEIGNLFDAQETIVRTINDVRAGKISATEGNTIARLIKVFMQTCMVK